jgi:hypothetical protein
MPTVTVYGVGGMDPSKPNNNVIDQYEVPDYDAESGMLAAGWDYTDGEFTDNRPDPEALALVGGI